jgi:glycerol-3-phosphate dehydrogenase
MKTLYTLTNWLLKGFCMSFLCSCSSSAKDSPSADQKIPEKGPIPNRESQIERLSSENFDLLVIGGGATGTGIAVDAASRGLKVALVEADDFASGTSSRSTKLVHGGVRYLEHAFKHMDYGQYHLVTEALHERATFLQNAPHLTRTLPILIPLYSWWEIPYYFFGIKLYDWVAGDSVLRKSKYVSATNALKRFPYLNRDLLKGAIVYYDGQFNDARANVSLASTAASLGAAVVNHLEVNSLIKENDRVVGARVFDILSKKTWSIQAKVVVNATGAFSDIIRHMDNPATPSIILTSSGSHIIIDKSYCPKSTGILIPKTIDGRVLFMLPWEGGTLVGTTDTPAALTATPQPSDKDFEFFFKQMKRGFGIELKPSEIRSSWSGLRPLVVDPKEKASSMTSRDHIIEVSPSNLITIAGGKWTTYRKMAEDAVDRAIEVGELKPLNKCVTNNLPIMGADGYSVDLTLKLEEEYQLPRDIAYYLAHSYGSRARMILDAAPPKRIIDTLPFLEAEIPYVIENEYAATPMDVLARRLTLPFRQHDASVKMVPRLVDLIGDYYEWDDDKRAKERNKTYDALYQLSGAADTRLNPNSFHYSSISH